MKKYYCSVAAIIAAAVVILLVGNALGLWEVSTGSQGMLGLIAVLPAVIWIFFKGLNLVNAGLYIGGVDYILVTKFLPFEAAVGLIIAEAAAIVICIIIIYTQKNKALEAAQEADSGTSEEQDG